MLPVLFSTTLSALPITAKTMHDDATSKDVPCLTRLFRSTMFSPSLKDNQFCMAAGVVLSANGHALCVNLSINRPLSWHVLHIVPRSASRCTCAEHQSGPPNWIARCAAWLEPAITVLVAGGL